MGGNVLIPGPNEGFLWVVRDILVNTDIDAPVFAPYSQQSWYVADEADLPIWGGPYGWLAPSSPWHWEGRQVINPFEEFHIYAVSCAIWVRMEGYLLSGP